MKTCSKCNNKKPITDFYKQPTRADGLQSYCKSCFSTYCAERWKERKRKAIAYKGGKCEDCGGEFEYYLFDFHHLDPTQKEFDWGKLRLKSWKKVTAELDKCAILCCMCHRKREYSRYASSVGRP